MKTNPEALKALYVAAGGDASAVADAVTSVDVLNAMAVLFGGDGDATTNPDAIDNIAAVYTAGFEPVDQQDLYDNKFIAYSDGVVLVVGGVFAQFLAPGETFSRGFVNVKAPKGKTLTKVFEYVPSGYTLGVSSEAVTVANNTSAVGSPVVFGLYKLS
jgi:hypothetical protein